MNNTVSCGTRILIGDKQNCDEQKKKLYTNIVEKIQKTKIQINDEKNNSLDNKEVSIINKTLNDAESHFGSKLTSHA